MEQSESYGLEDFRAIPAKDLRGKPLDDLLKKYGRCLRNFLLLTVIEPLLPAISFID